jgi:3-oxoacyl-[acyl-carrier protein] reductase
MCARNQQTLAAAAEKIRKQHNSEVFAEAFDVADSKAVAKFVAAVVAKFGSVDICVTNAGGPPAKGFLAATLDDWQRAIDLNFLSTVYFAREVIPHMQRQHWGRIITITSITTKQPVADLVLSNAVRAAVVGLVKSLANRSAKTESWSTTSVRIHSDGSPEGVGKIRSVRKSEQEIRTPRRRRSTETFEANRAN